MLTKIPFQPGIVKDDPAYSSEPYWSDGNNVRFYRGLPEKIGGWAKYSTDTFTGKCRNLYTWQSNDGAPYAAIGTNTGLFVDEGGIFYDITPTAFTAGDEFGGLGLGWGIGPWGEETWNTERSSTDITLDPHVWALDSWGQNLLASSPTDGGLYEWTLDTAVIAQPVTNAPGSVQRMFVDPLRFVVLLGCEDTTSTFDPMLVRWCDQENNTVWSPTATNAAGSYRLSSGSRIIGGTVSRGQNLIWTDRSLYSMTYLGDTEFIFGFQLLGTNCGLIGPNAFVEKDGVVYWMSNENQFFMYDGGAVQILDSPVRNYVFDNYVPTQRFSINAGLNTEHNEIWWFYTADSVTEEIDSYVAYNFREGSWFIGDVPRSAWSGSSVYAQPLAAGLDGYLYAHELGYTADGSTLSGFIQSAPFDIGDGDQVMSVKRVVPDVLWSGPTQRFEIEMTTKRYPQDVTEETKTRTFFDNDDRFWDLRTQGRQAQIKYSCTSEAGWRIGSTRIDIEPKGRR